MRSMCWGQPQLISSSQSIHADIAYTLGKYLMTKLRPDSKTTTEDMNIANLVVREGLVAQKNTTVPQLIQVSYHDGGHQLGHIQPRVALLDQRRPVARQRRRCRAHSHGPGPLRPCGQLLVLLGPDEAPRPGPYRHFGTDGRRRRGQPLFARHDIPALR